MLLSHCRSSRLLPRPSLSAHLARPMPIPVPKRGILDIAQTDSLGRSSVSGLLVTVFGATGFLGRYVVNQLGRVGSQVIVTWRGEPKSYTHLKVMGDLGQIIPCEVNIRDKESLRAAVKHSNVVINLVGQDADSRFNTMQETHVDAAKRIAEVAAEANVERLIHLSALRVTTDSESDWVRTKREGEAAVRSVFPEATIMRPATIWGAQDNLLNSRASMARYWPVSPIVHPEKKDSYVFVNDVATAITMALKDPSTIGKTYQLGGEVMTERELFEWVAMVLKLSPRTIETDDPDFLFNMGYWLGMHRKPRFHPDALLRKEDSFVDSSALGFEDLGLSADLLQPLKSQLALSYIQSYRKPVRQQDVSLDEEPEEVAKLERGLPIRHY